MTRKYEPISIKRADIHGNVCNGLCAVDENAHTVSVSDCNQLGNGRDGSENVGNVCNRDKFGSPRKQLLIFRKDQLSRLIHGNDLDDRSRLLRYELPRNDIGVMLQERYDDLITGL